MAQRASKAKELSVPDAAPAALIPLARDTVDGAVVQTVGARELHSFLGVRCDFTTWIRAMVAKYGFAGAVDLVTAEGLTSPDGRQDAEGRGGQALLY